MRKFLLFAFSILVLSSVAFAIEPKQVGSAFVDLKLEWDVQGDFDGSKMLRTFGFPNTSFQTIWLASNTPYTTEKDEFGNDILVFQWSENGFKDIELSVMAKASYDVPYVSGSAEDASKYSSSTKLVVVDDSIATQAHFLTKNAASDFEKLTRITEWVNNVMTYDDSFWQRQPTSSDVFIQRRGVCNQYALLAMALLRASGIPSRFVAGWVYSGKKWGPHAWLEAYIDGHWVPADPTYGEVGMLDGTHVVFAYGYDQLDIKEEFTGGLRISKKQTVSFIESASPRDFFDSELFAPEKVGSSAAENITVSLKNRDSQERAIPLNLIVPTQPPESAVQMADYPRRLAYLPSGGSGDVSWGVVFPDLKEGYLYNFTIEVDGFGKKQQAYVQGQAGLSSPLTERIILKNIESVQGDGEIAIVATLSNAGNANARANVAASLGSQSQEQTVLLQKGETRDVRFVFKKPLADTHGELAVTVGSNSFSQPFDIVEAENGVVQLSQEGFDYQTVALVGAGAAVLIGLAFFLWRRAKTP
ncbi:TPA: transglutaminase domain-containing protein [Candidatus Micrarchaeota archaeon]|nr:transglutaminase domain-containing protein [Candidatus Micrarchaeota archaeon]